MELEELTDRDHEFLAAWNEVFAEREFAIWVLRPIDAHYLGDFLKCLSAALPKFVSLFSCFSVLPVGGGFDLHLVCATLVDVTSQVKSMPANERRRVLCDTRHVTALGDEEFRRMFFMSITETCRKLACANVHEHELSALVAALKGR